MQRRQAAMLQGRPPGHRSPAVRPPAFLRKTGGIGVGRCATESALPTLCASGSSRRPMKNEPIVDLARASAFVITPYFASLMDPTNPDCPVRRQVVPRMAERGGRGRTRGSPRRSRALAGQERDAGLSRSHRILRQQRVRALLPILLAQADGG